MIRRLLAIAGALLCAYPAVAQQSPAKVESPWYMQARLSSAISVTTSSAATALPLPGFIGWLCNTGSYDAYLTLGTSNAVTTSATAGDYLKAGTCGSYDLYPIGTATRYSYVALIGSGGSTTVTVETGIGQPPSQVSASGSSPSAPVFVTSYDSGPVSVSATPANASHAAGVSVGGLYTIPLARVSGGSGILTSILVKSSGGFASSYVLRVWSRNPSNTTCTDNSAFVGSAADDAYLMGSGPTSVSMAAPANTTGDSSTYGSLTSLTWDYATNGNANVYACLVTTATDTADQNAAVLVTMSGPQN